MRTIVFLLMCCTLTGCDYKVPLVTTPTVPMDSRVTGLWQRTVDHGQTEGLLILPLSKEESLVAFPVGPKETTMYARACLCRVGTKTLVQLNWFGTSEGKVADNGQVYQFADYSLSGDTISIRLLNSDVVNREVSSYDELATAISENTGKTNLFRDAMVFKKASK
jgi:hypothetical protein